MRPARARPPKYDTGTMIGYALRHYQRYVEGWDDSEAPAVIKGAPTTTGAHRAAVLSAVKQARLERGEDPDAA